MTTYKGEYLEPAVADGNQTAMINAVVKLDDQLKTLIEKRNELLSNLPKGSPLVVETEEGHRTFIVDEPTGHYVTYRPLDFAMNAKTTKADLKEITANV